MSPPCAALSPESWRKPLEIGGKSQLTGVFGAYKLLPVNQSGLSTNSSKPVVGDRIARILSLADPGHRLKSEMKSGWNCWNEFGKR